MGDSKYFPDRWSDYIKLTKRSGGRPAQNWAIFASRYRAAGNFIGADFFYLSDRSKRSYSTAIGYLLCFSAFEAACTAYGIKTHKCPILDDGIPFKSARSRLRICFRRTTEHEFPLRWAIESPLLGNKIDDFFAGRDQDLRPLAASLRNLFAHGIFTPTGSGVLRESSCQGLELLGKCLLIKSDQLLEYHLAALLQ